MLFNSFHFLLFFPLVCILYYLLPPRLRWLFLLLASYYFYMNWEPVYALLIAGSTLITYGCGLLVERYRGERRRQRLFLLGSLLLNFGILFIFKYYNFLTGSIFSLLSWLGIRSAFPEFTLLLPVGISFYTFQAVGYSLDVYRGDIKAERHLGIYALFVSFFPQLVAGPIERARNLLPQFREIHRFDETNATQGLKLMLWGYFMKLCVADRLALYVDAVYNNVSQHNGTSLLIASVFFAFQIYCDFGGYSLIAIGAARVMGFSLMENFRRPYFARSVREFWGRWHISLSTWFKDYVYIPLGGNRVGRFRHMRNLVVTFLVSGIWHGANWTFILWGGFHGGAQVMEKLMVRSTGDNKYKWGGVKIFITFLLVCFGWIFFRANRVEDAFEVIRKIFTEPGPPFIHLTTVFFGVISLVILLLKDIADEYRLPFHFLDSRYVVIRYFSVCALVAYILLFGMLNGGQFIYFQF